MTETPTPVTTERIAAILQDESIPYEIIGGSVMVAYAEFGIYFGVYDQAIGAAGNWSGAVDPSLITVALGATNEWNLTQITPMLAFSVLTPGEEGPTPSNPAEGPKPGDVISFAFRRTGILGEGWTHNQLGAWLMTTIEQVISLVRFLERQVPETTTTITGGEYIIPADDTTNTPATEEAER